MKKTFLLFALVLIVALWAVVALVLPVRDSQDEVTVTAEILAGDPSAAEGLVATQTAHYADQLFWEMTIPLDDPEDTTTAYSATDALPPAERTPSISYLSFWCSTSQSFSASEPVLDSLLPNFQPLEPIFADVIDRTPAGETYTETLYLSDYVDTLPFCVEFNARHDFTHTWEVNNGDTTLEAVLQDFFRFPVPSGAQWSFTVTKDPSGAVESLAYDCGNYASLGFLTACGKDAVYLAFQPSHHPPLSFADIPGGYGIYRISMTREETETKSTFRLDGDSLENAFPLPEETTVLDLAVTPDGSTLLVTCGQNPDYTLLVLDLPTMEVRQTLTVPAVPPDVGTTYAPNRDGSTTPYSFYQWDLYGSTVTDTSLVLWSSDLFHFYSLEEDGWVYRFSAPQEDLVDHVSVHPVQIAWNGERLAIATLPWRGNSNPTGLDLSVYDDQGQLLYAAEYATSLNELASEDAEYEAQKQQNQAPAPDLSLYRSIQLAEGYELTLTWT